MAAAATLEPVRNELKKEEEKLLEAKDFETMGVVRSAELVLKAAEGNFSRAQAKIEEAKLRSEIPILEAENKSAAVQIIKDAIESLIVAENVKTGVMAMVAGNAVPPGVVLAPPPPPSIIRPDWYDQPPWWTVAPWNQTGVWLGQQPRPFASDQQGYGGPGNGAPPAGWGQPYSQPPPSSQQPPEWWLHPPPWYYQPLPGQVAPPGSPPVPSVPPPLPAGHPGNGWLPYPYGIPPGLPDNVVDMKEPPKAETDKWLSGEQGRMWLDTPHGLAWLTSSPGQQWLYTAGGQQWLWSPWGGRWLTTPSGMTWAAQNPQMAAQFMPPAGWGYGGQGYGGPGNAGQNNGEPASRYGGADQKGGADQNNRWSAGWNADNNKWAGSNKGVTGVDHKTTPADQNNRWTEWNTDNNKWAGSNIGDTGASKWNVFQNKQVPVGTADNNNQWAGWNADNNKWAGSNSGVTGADQNNRWSGWNADNNKWAGSNNGGTGASKWNNGAGDRDSYGSMPPGAASAVLPVEKASEKEVTESLNKMLSQAKEAQVAYDRVEETMENLKSAVSMIKEFMSQV